MKRSTKLILGGIIAIYMWCLYVYINTPIITDIARNGVLEDSINTDAYIIRNEHLITSKVEGNVFRISQEGEKIKKNAIVATIYKGNNNNAQEKLNELNQRINNIKQSDFGNNLFSRDLEKLDSRIMVKANEIIESAYKNNLVELKSIKNDINGIIDKKLLISGDKGPNSYNLHEIEKLKVKYEEQLMNDKSDLFASRSGIVSYNIDNMEQILNPKKIHEFKPSDFTKLDQINFDLNVQVKEGQAVAKIIDNFEWYLGFTLDKKDVYDIKAGDSLKIRFSTKMSEPMGAAVYYISPEEKGKVLVLLSVDRYIDNISEIRKTNIDVIKHTYSGFKVPISSVRVQDGKHGIYVVRDRIARFCEVEILYNSNDFAIVKENNLSKAGLLLYDEVVVKGSDIKDDTIVR